MNLSLQGKRALVCGASRGIGRSCAYEIAALGASVTLLARDGDRLSSIVTDLPCEQGQQHAALIVDLASPEATRNTVRTHLEKWGTAEILVNNAGGPPGGPLIEASLEQFLAAMVMHLFTSHLLVQLALPGMRSAGYGRIINIISTSVKQPIKDLGVSNTTRGAVASWAKTLAEELGPWGVTVNNVLPGATRTDRIEEIISAKAEKSGTPRADIEAQLISQIPLGRFAESSELGSVVAFLASPAASYVSGVSIPVDGGRTRSF